MSSGGTVYEKYWNEKFNYADGEKRFYEGKNKTAIDDDSGIDTIDKKKSSVVYETFWVDKDKYDRAERDFFAKTGEKVKREPKVSETVDVMEEVKAAPAAPSVACCDAAVSPKKSSKKENRKNKKKNNANVQEKEKENVQSKPCEPPIVEKVDTVVETVVDTAVVVKSSENTKGMTVQNPIGLSSLASEVAKARQHIKKSLECMDTMLLHVPNDEVEKKLNSLQAEMKQLKIDFNAMKTLVGDLRDEIKQLRETVKTVPILAVCPPCPAPKAAPPRPVDDDEDDGVDLFASDSEEDDAAAKLKEQRLAEYAAKKSKKPALIAKSNIILDVKPWDDETDMGKMEELVRTITTEGLLWGASKLVPLAYGIRKLQISCVVQDDIVSVDWIQEEIEKFEDYVQSVDIAAFNKI